MLTLSAGEQSLAFGFAKVCLAGALTAVTTADMLLQGALDHGVFVWSILCGALGVGWALVVCIRWLGHSGRIGVFKFVFAALSIGFVGAVAAGSLILPIYGTMFGPFALTMAFVNVPGLALIWFVSIGAAHCAAIRWREEHDTIFHVELPETEGQIRG